MSAVGASRASDRALLAHVARKRHRSRVALHPQVASSSSSSSSDEEQHAKVERRRDTRDEESDDDDESDSSSSAPARKKSRVSSPRASSSSSSRSSGASASVFRPVVRARSRARQRRIGFNSSDDSDDDRDRDEEFRPEDAAVASSADSTDDSDEERRSTRSRSSVASRTRARALKSEPCTATGGRAGDAHDSSEDDLRASSEEEEEAGTAAAAAARPLSAPRSTATAVAIRSQLIKSESRAPAATTSGALDVDQIILQCITGSQVEPDESIDADPFLHTQDMMLTQEVSQSQPVGADDDDTDFGRTHEAEFAHLRAVKRELRAAEASAASLEHAFTPAAAASSSSAVAGVAASPLPPLPPISMLGATDLQGPIDPLTIDPLTSDLGPMQLERDRTRGLELLQMKTLQIYALRFRHAAKFRASEEEMRDLQLQSDDPQEGEEEDAIVHPTSPVLPPIEDDGGVAPMEIDGESVVAPPSPPTRPMTAASLPSTPARITAPPATSVDDPLARLPREFTLSPSATPDDLFAAIRRSHRLRAKSLDVDGCSTTLYRALREFLRPVLQLLIVVKSQRQFLLKQQKSAETKERHRRQATRHQQRKTTADTPAATADLPAAAAAAADPSPPSSGPKTSSKREMELAGCITLQDVEDIMSLLGQPMKLPPTDDDPDPPSDEEKAVETAPPPVNKSIRHSKHSHLVFGRTASSKALTSVRARRFFSPAHKEVMLRALAAGTVSHRLGHVAACEELAKQLTKMADAPPTPPSTDSDDRDAAAESPAGDLNLSLVHSSKKKKQQPPKLPLLVTVTGAQVRAFLLNHAARLKKRQPELGRLLMCDIADLPRRRAEVAEQHEVDARRRASRLAKQLADVTADATPNDDDDDDSSQTGTNSDEESVAREFTMPNYIRWEDLTDEQKQQLESSPAGTIAIDSQQGSRGRGQTDSSNDAEEEDGEEDDAPSDADEETARAARHQARRQARKRAKKEAKKEAKRAKKALKRAKKRARREADDEEEADSTDEEDEDARDDNREQAASEADSAAEEEDSSAEEEQTDQSD